MTKWDVFCKCTKTKLLKDGSVEIYCKLGLWRVFGRDIKVVEQEAHHYWIQYYYDGEYNNLLAKEKKS